ncbi:MAG: cupin domain-containing protein [Deltaproteobacteria bacterium]|nr:cupin domain-containing protein [Deltaproteobacteria bacterium]MBW2383237.1 cupin domain-containing protein [Deltaproteobacteria bacterium]MBW2696365.1 cupin domain-containing protein [Deltaproteobacteria bacterium]
MSTWGGGLPRKGVSLLGEAGWTEGSVADNDWKKFELPKEIEARIASGKPYLEFLRVPSLSCGIYALPAGSEDLQAPHDEDEVYYVVSGKARLRVSGETVEAGPGSILYVRATATHSFFEVEEDMTILVFFASGGPGD